MLDDVFDIALDRVKLGFAQVLDLLGQMLDVEAVVALESACASAFACCWVQA